MFKKLLTWVQDKWFDHIDVEYYEEWNVLKGVEETQKKFFPEVNELKVEREYYEGFAYPKNKIRDELGRKLDKTIHDYSLLPYMYLDINVLRGQVMIKLNEIEKIREKILNEL